MATRPVSLPMILHKCREYYQLRESITNRISDITRLNRPADMASEETLEKLRGDLDAVRKLLADMECSSPTLMLHLDILTWDFDTLSSISLEAIVRELEHIQRSIMAELSVRKFVFVPSPDNEFFQKDQLFGGSVYEAFPAAREELKNAGTAYAIELYTACIFHLMRVSEHGLRGLARQVKAKVQSKYGLVPLEYADWHSVITAIKERIKASREQAQGPKKQRQLEFYSDAADHCEYIKDIWRNTTSHSRKLYNQSDALQAMDRVKAFMQFLSIALKERW